MIGDGPIATGKKTYNDAISMAPDPSDRLDVSKFMEAESAWERAEAHGKTTAS